MQILIVDDRMENRYLLETVLGSDGHDTVSAENGRKALEWLASSPFDLIISDILMPVMDGFQLCRHCKADPALRLIPFVFYTATYVDEKDEIFAYEIGADGFLRKGMEPADFLTSIQKMIENFGQGRLSPKPPVQQPEEETCKQYSERLIHKLEKKMQDLKEKEERLNMALEASRDGLWDWNVQTGEVYFTPRYYTMLGYAPYELPQSYDTWAGLLHPDDRERAEKLILGHIENNAGPFEQEFRMKTRSGQWKWILGRGRVFSVDDQGRPVRVVGTHTDISRLKAAVQQTRETRKRYRNIIEVSPVGIAIHAEGRVVFTNPAGAGILGAESPDQLIGKPIHEIIHPDHLEAARDRMQRMMAGEPDLYPVEDRYVRLDGRPIDVMVMATPLTYKGAPAVQVVVQDITEKKKTERELKIRNEVAQIFLTTPGDEIYDKILALVLDMTQSRYGIFGFIDEAGEWVCPSLTRDIWENCRVPGKRIAFPHDTWTGIWGQAMTEKTCRYINRQLCLPEGHIAIDNALDAPVVYQDRLVGNLLIGQKGTGYTDDDRHLMEIMADQIAPVLKTRLERDQEQKERRQAETRLQQVQKLEAIGSLAGGIAHDFNNILSAIIGYTQLVMDQLPEDSPAQEDLKQVYKGGERAKDLVRQILAFSRQQEQHAAPVQIGPIVKEVLKFLKSTLPASLIIRQQIAPDTGMILADPTQIHQVLMNLCTNAAQAMDSAGGTLTVILSGIFLDSEKTAPLPDLLPGKYLRLSVTDTGHGIAPEILPKIFDPYFTTKRRGQGTGLGLATVHGIVKSYGGGIRVSSTPGQGTAFEVYFPVMDNPVEPVPETPVPAAPAQSRACILMVDDEPPIASLGKQLLEILGYQAEARSDPLEALALFKAAPDRFDVVITDLTMPGMKGDRLAGELTRIRPDLPVILCSGFSMGLEKKEAEAAGIKAFIQKPILKNHLAAVIRQVLTDRL